MDCASIIFGKALDYVVDPVVQNLAYTFNYKGNVEVLRQLAQDLRAAREAKLHEVDEAIRNGKEIEMGAEKWLKNANDTITKIEEFLNDKGHEKTGCSYALFPNNLLLRYRLSKQAKKKERDVTRLLSDALDLIGRVSYRPGSTSMDAALSNIGYESFKSRSGTMKEIMAVLGDSTVRMIGIYGSGGVGKTALVKEVAKRALDNNLFNLVILVNVTGNPDVKKIQGEIAAMLDLRLEEESEIGRADRLRRRLTREKENALIILDDLWERLDLNRLGIPFDDDDFSEITTKDTPDVDYNIVKKEKGTGEYKGCKILLTSRSQDVLSAEIYVKKTWSVDLLEKKEAENLFTKVAGAPDKSRKSEFELLTAEIVKQCGGLPMAIVSVARGLKNKGYSEWNDALGQLKRQEFMVVHKPMEFSIKLSYSHLESKELKSVFLLCAQMGGHALIMDLTKYCIGLGIFQGVHTIREARSRTDASIRKLKSSSLLLDSDSSYHFYMHDMVRDVALSIASKEQNVFIVRNGKIDEWPDEDELERCTAISIHNSDIIDELPQGINCPQLKVCHIDSDDPSMRIPDNFFAGMRNLRVLILTGFRLPNLPSLIKCLKKLKMLCLEQCQLDENLSIIGELKKLRVLSFYGSEFENLPAELGQLGKLQLLDISNCSKLKGIPPNFISCLKILEELYMRNSSVQWEIGELRHMHQLTILDICIPNAELLPTDVFFDKLDSFKIVIGDSDILSMGDFKMRHKYEASRTLALQLKEATDIHSQEGIKMLFERVEILLLAELNGVQSIFNELNLHGFPILKHLSIVNNFEIGYIINEIGFCPRAFPRLESLCLYNLKKLEKICSTKLSNGSFGNLKSIRINVCGQLKNLFSFDMVQLLTKLETIEVSECGSLEEIVVRERDENNDNNMKVNNNVFPELRSLTLRSLPKFTGFYTSGKMLSEPQLTERQLTNSDCNEIAMVDEHRLTPPFSLFKQVGISSLESLELSSVTIDNIWSEQTSPCFEKLIKLNLKDCARMEALFPFSIATSLSNLKALSISSCKKMVEIFLCEDLKKDEAKFSIFPKLEEIQVSGMDSLKKIWPSQVRSDSFGSLTSVVIEKCEELETVFPGHMVGKFQKLISLKIFDCKSVVEIFDLEKSTPKTNSGNETSLQFFHIKELPKLRHLWNKDPEGILSFKNLQTVEVYRCHELKNLFTVSVAKDLEKIQYLAVLHCNEMEEIISSEQSSIQQFFPKVSFFQFQRLPKLKSFYGGRRDLEWPELKRLAVCYCGNPKEQPVFLNEKVVCGLEMLTITITFEESEWIQRCIGEYRMQSLKDLRLASLPSIEILYQLLRRIPNLEDLTLYSCSVKEVLPRSSLTAQEKIGIVVRLKGLVLWDLSALENIGLERNPVFQRIERLRLHRCPRLINIVPASGSLTCLTHLEVSECDALINLMAFSTAKSLIHLTTMKVVKCKLMEEIVGKDRSDEERVDEIVFSKLMTVELVSLESLKSFCSSNCAFKLPSLEKLIVRECPIMKFFSDGVTSTPKLRQVRIVEQDEEKWHWNGSLNDTIRTIFRETFACGVEHLKVSDQPMLKEIWNGEVTVSDRWFGNLKSLVIKGCEFMSNVIPSNLLPFLSKLEELEVRDCNSVKVIYDVKGITEERKLKKTGPALPLPFPLKKLILKDLPNLEQVWNRDPQGILGLQILQEVHVERCKCLRSLFPESVAKDLVKLESLVVRYCEEIVEITAKDDEAAPETAKEFVFPLTSLTLWELPKLKWFYPGLHKLVCPQLKNLDVHHCIMLEILTARPENQAPASVAKVIPYLRKLSFNKEDIMMIWSGQYQANLLQNLKSIVLQCFHSRSNIFPYGFFQMVPHIEEVEVRCCHFKEIFSKDGPDMDDTGILSQLKELRLNFLPELNSIGLAHSWLVSIVKNLGILEVCRCPSLLNLEPSAVSFSNLTDLTVSECHQLQYLYSSSTARSMCLLEKMSITHCESLQEIVAKERDELDQDEITFSQLKTLYLDSLPSLLNFYTGSYTLNFSSLCQVSVFECPTMKIFSQGDVIAPKLSGVKFQGHISEPKLFGDEFQEHTDRVRWDRDLNTTIQKAFEETDAEFPSYVQHLKLRDHAELKKIWHRAVQVPDTCFSNLKSLIVEGCEFISSVIPSYLLSFLSTLEELEVRKCDSVKVIFDMKDITGDRKNMNIGQGGPRHFSLKKMSIEQLQNLEHIWNSDPQGIFSLHALQEMHVDGCSSLKSLFPVSVAKDLVKLEDLNVRSCHGLEGIVAKDEAAEGGETEKFVFPCVTTLILGDLPKLMYFYSGRHEVECPRLKNLRIYLCNKLGIFGIFAPKFERHQQEHPDDEVGIPINRQALPSVDKVLLNLELLSLSKEDVTMICQGNFQDNLLHKLKSLELHSFDDKLIFPFGLLETVHKVEKLKVSYSSFRVIFSYQAFGVLNEFSSELEDHSRLSSMLTSPGQYLWPEHNAIELERSGLDPVYTGMLSQLKVLNLNDLPELSSIGLEHSWMKHISKGLKTLEVYRCPSLVNLVPSKVFFSNLTDLSVFECHGLKYLFTSSTAKTMLLLEKMCITQCESLQEIVAKEQNESDQDVIFFSKLNTLYLDSLPSLVRFYSGNSNLQLPCLEQISVFECPGMIIFCQSKVCTPKLFGVEFKGHIDGVRWCGDLNTTIWKPFEETIPNFVCDVKYLELSKHPELKKIWNGVVSVPETCFSNLKSLVVEGCEFLSTIIPSSVLPFLSNLEELEVKNCNSAEVIFDVRDIRGDGRMKNTEPALFLKKMILNQLPNLEHVWNKESQEVGGLELLEEVYIDGCIRLRSLFPASVAKYLVKLEKLDVKYCEGMVEIVGKDEAATGGVTKECGSFTVSFSNLKELRLAECHGLLYIFTYSTAKSLAQLETIFIEKCESIKEIVAKEVNDATQDEIIFEQLKVLSLNSLSSLQSFYEGNCTLSFPSLVEAIITQCPEMKIFSQGLIRAPMLEAVQISPERRVTCRDGNLNPIIKKLFERKVAKLVCEVQILKLRDYPTLEEIFNGVAPVPNESYFSNLKILVVEGCKFLSSVIPFSLLIFLNNLEELKVGNCDSVKVIFDLEDTEEVRKMIHMTPASSQSFPRIKKLTLGHLPNLEHVWNVIDCQGIFNFQVLQKVVVEGCKSLKSLFPATMAKDLVALEELHVKYCEVLVEIVAKNEAATEGATEEFVFPCLMSVILWELPEFKYFYPGLHRLKWPMVKELDMYRCYNLQFTSESQKFSLIYQPFSCFRRLISLI